MLGRRRKLAELAFSAGILKSFGKLNQQDIDAIDGCPERLVRQLINQYGWTRDAAQDRVEASFECRPKAQKDWSVIYSLFKLRRANWRKIQVPIAASGQEDASHHWWLTPFPATHMKNENASSKECRSTSGVGKSPEF